MENVGNQIFLMVERDDFAALRKIPTDQLYSHDPVTGDTPLRLALRKCDSKIQQYLIEHGVLKMALEEIGRLTIISQALISVVGENGSFLSDKIKMFSITLSSLWKKQPPCNLGTYKAACHMLLIFIKSFIDEVEKCSEVKGTTPAITSYSFECITEIRQELYKIVGTRWATREQNLTQSTNVSGNDVFVILNEIREYLCNGGWI